MVFDQLRNDLYYEALKRVITPDSVVLDLGSGLGIHGLMAAKFGAKKVYMVEPEDVITISKEIALANGLEKKLHFFKGKIEDVSLPSQVDVIVSVFTGNLMVNEDLLPSLFYARDMYLRENGHLIPEKAILYAVPVYVPELYENEIERWDRTPSEIDFSLAKTYAANTIFYPPKELAKARFLAKPAIIMEMDLATAKYTLCDATVSYYSDSEGSVHAFAGWFDIRLGEKWLSTSPKNPKTHWSSAFLPISPPLKLSEGEEITFRLLRPENGDWSWFLKAKEHEQKHSTFLAQPLSPSTIEKLSKNYTPSLNEEGMILQFVLSLADGSITTWAIAEKLVEKYPDSYSSESAMKFVRGLANKYG